eukprot:scaffold55231_cov30-Tisochrysis_lutea.AAC.1
MLMRLRTRGHSACTSALSLLHVAHAVLSVQCFGCPTSGKCYQALARSLALIQRRSVPTIASTCCIDCGALTVARLQVDYVQGWGKITSPHTVEVTANDGSKQTLNTKSI